MLVHPSRPHHPSIGACHVTHCKSDQEDAASEKGVLTIHPDLLILIYDLRLSQVRLTPIHYWQCKLTNVVSSSDVETSQCFCQL